MRTARALIALVALGITVGRADERVHVDKNVEATMRDGVILRADVYRPSAPGTYPVLLQRTPYSKNDDTYRAGFAALAQRGFAVIVQDTRGRYMSDGVARPHDEAEDGFDTIAWARRLPYSNGKVGMWGGSYLATTQLLAATTSPEGLVVLFPSSSYSSRYDMVFQGGAFYLNDGLGWNLGQAIDMRRRVLTPDVGRDNPIGLDEQQRKTLREDWLWQLPLASMDALELRRFAPGYFDMLSHPSYDAFWETFDIEAKHQRIEAPAHHLTGWYDTLLTGTLRNFTGLRARAANEPARRFQRLVVGPWTHARPTLKSTKVHDVDFGPTAGFSAQSQYERWFDAFLRDGDRSVLQGPPVRIFVMGENKWRDEQEWPLARARATPFYLHSGGILSTTAPAEERPDTFTYDPSNPVPTGAIGGYSRMPSDQRAVEKRPDVLVYSSAPLDRDVEVTGPLSATLWITSSAPDTDFTAKLVDVHPDGTARAINDGILRTRYRRSKSKPELLTPGEPVEITIDIGATSNVFLRGHRIRLDISSSNFPRFDRNPNTGAPFGTGTEVRRATQTVFHQANRPSRLILPVIPRQSTDVPLLGFAPDAARAERAAEARFIKAVSIPEMSRLHREVTRRPHVAGSPAAKAVAETLVTELRRAGLDASIREFTAYVSTPRRVSAEIVEPTRVALSVIEPANDRDPDSKHAELGPGYVAYSGSGTVTAPVVYANYGLPPDYEQLAKQKVDVKGKIVLARYGRSHRAVKIHLAEQAGAVGIIVYSDPADDGEARGPVWPNGPWRADFQLQRGNGKYSWFWHGDPLTPGYASTADSQRLDANSVPTLPRIPAVVLPAREAAKIQSRLTGPASVTVKLDVEMNDRVAPLYNVTAFLRGRDPDRYAIIGTHHDAWTFGGMDPGSGLTAVFEVARGLAALRKTGWVPERSVLFAFWDGEEFGLLGSTEQAEGEARRYREQAIAYINTDLFMKGRFDGGGTPSLRDFLVEVTKDVPSFAGESVYSGWRRTASSEVELAALGSGADFVAFQDFLGLPTLQMEFDFEGSYGTYHSNYDTRWYVEHFSDPGFEVARTLVQVLGLSVMRLASAPALPFRYSHYAGKVDQFLASTATWPGAQTMTLRLDEATALAKQIAVRAATLESEIDRALASGTLTAAGARDMNDRLVRLEQTLLDESLPPDKRWYRHVVYGWNIYSLYEGQPLPGIADAIRLGDQAMLDREVKRVEAALHRMLNALEQIHVESH